METVLNSMKSKFEGNHFDIALLAFEVGVIKKYPKYFYETSSKMRV